MKRIRETKTQELIRRLKYNKSAVFGLAIVVILILCAVFANFIAPNSPTPSPPELSNALKPGFWSEDGVEGMPLGADGLGRCVLSRILYGARVSLTARFCCSGNCHVPGNNLWNNSRILWRMDRRSYYENC